MSQRCNKMDPWARIEQLELMLERRERELERLRNGQSILDITEDLVFAVDQRLRVFYANPSCIRYGTRALCCSESDFLGKSLPEIAMSERLRGCDLFRREFNGIEALFTSTGSYYVESNIRIDDRFVWFGVRLQPVLDDAGVVSSVAGVARDITKQKAIQTVLADEKDRLIGALARVGDAVLTTDADGAVTSLNKLAEKLTGWSAERAKGQPVDAVFKTIDENSRAQSENPVRGLLSRANEFYLYHEVVDKILLARDGRETQISSTSALLRGDNRAVVGTVLVFRDASGQKAAEEEMHRVQKLESVGLLAGGIAHDFNNILTSVMGNLSLAQRRAEGNKALFSRLEDAEKAVVRAQSLTAQLLTFSKGGAPIKTVASVKTIIEESATFSLIGSAVQCVISIPDDLWRVEVDEGQISQVIQNLVINAEQAMPRGGTVYLSAKNCAVEPEDGLPLSPGQYVMITVADEGGGIPPQLLDRVFDPYFTTKKEGTGLGLATTHSIIRRHGGHITVDSRENIGTTFMVYLPGTEERVSSDFIHEYLPDLRQGRILIMDDEADIREVAASILRELGFEVETAGDGEETIRRYLNTAKTELRFDVVIMDLTIPGGIGGRECLARLKSVDPNVKAIVTSGYSTDPVMSEYRNYGFEGRVTKPYGVTQMARVLRKVLGPLGS